jgi:uncharacterized protein YndB with AHSA1/START domain
MTDGWTYEYSFPIPAPADRIFRALTKDAELEQWFAEHARVEARPGGAFRFWGRHTVGTPDESDAMGSVVDIEPDARLAFDWTMFGVPTRVGITLTPEEIDHGSATRVAVEHTFDRVIDGPRPKELVDDWWRFTLGNLTAHTAGHGQIMRPDFADPSPEVTLSIEIDAPPEKVFRALTEPEALNQWMARDATVDLRVGGTFDLGWQAPDEIEHQGPAMEILELEPNSKLTISWPDWRGDTSVPTQSVTWMLEPDGDGTRVTLVHSGFIRAVDVSDFPFGWAHFMGELKRVAEGL